MAREKNHREERRNFPRIRSLNLLSYFAKDGKTQKSPISMARTLDISAGGTKLEVYEILDLESLVEMEIAIKDTIFSIQGKVIYSEDLSNGKYAAGIEFSEINEELMKAII